jgi:hypothetical protein
MAITQKPLLEGTMTREELRGEVQESNLGQAFEQHAAGQLPTELKLGLARMALLYGVPFENLVPDLDALPVESIRFFFVDGNWIESLIDGAFSVGAHTSLDVRYHRVLQHAIRRATGEAAGKLRKDLRGEPAARAGATRIRELGGFLLRSALVSGWAGLEVQGFRASVKTRQSFPDTGVTPVVGSGSRLELMVGSTATIIQVGSNRTLAAVRDAVNARAAGVTAAIEGTAAPFHLRLTLNEPAAGQSRSPTPPVLELRTTPGKEDSNLLENLRLEILRLERLSPELLLCIFEEAPDRVEIHEPQEDLHFGVGGTEIPPRDRNTGKRVDGPGAQIVFRDAAAKVLDVARIAANLAELPSAEGERPFGPADFSVQMIDAADKRTFEVPRA